MNSVDSVIVGMAISLLLVACDHQALDAGIGNADSIDSLSVLAWENSFTVSSLRGFECEVDVRVDVQTFDTADELRERLAANPGRFDVVVVDDANLQELVDARLIRELDLSAVPNLSNIDKRFKNQGFDPGNRHSVPYIWGTTLIAYRNDKIRETDISWASVFGNSYAGKVTLLPEKTDCIASALIYAGVEPQLATRDEIYNAGEFLVDLSRKESVSFQGTEKASAALMSGEKWIAMMYSGDATVLAAENSSISRSIPKEGALFWVDNFAVARDSGQPELAYTFIDYMLEPRVAAGIANELRYPTPNVGATPYLEDGLLQDEAVYPPNEILERCGFLSSQGRDVLKLMNESWWEIHGDEEIENLKWKLNTKSEKGM